MLVKREIGERGQFIVPKDFREQLGLHPGTEITVEVKENELVVKPAKTPEEFLEEFCRVPKKVRIKDDIKWYKKVVDKRYEEEYGLS